MKASASEKNVRYNILVFEKDEKWKTNFSDALSNPYTVCILEKEKELFKELRAKNYDVIIFDTSSDQKNPFHLLHQVTVNYPFTPVIAISRNGHTDFVVDAIKQGAFDFITKPFSKEKLEHTINKAIEDRSLRNERDYLRHEQDIIYKFDRIPAYSPVMKDAIGELEKYSRSDGNILLTGETGTGKSFLAGTIHFNSLRKNKPFMTINCANIPETLLESELFGHEKGSFTSADKKRIGRFEQAKGGTVFLDEIGELSLNLQAKLLKVLEEKNFVRIGGSETIYADIRFITATHKNLEALIKEKKFRQDLYYRIKVLSVALPPLRERTQCIEPLSYFLLRKICCNIKKQIEGFSPEVMDCIKSYSWPGNIRELSNCIERSVILEESSIICEHTFPIKFGNDCTDSIKAKELEMILKALEDNNWVQKDAAKQLGISSRNMNYKIKKLGITYPKWRKHCKH